MATKVAGQEKDSSSAPPTIGPSAMAMPVLAPQSPIARARSWRSVNTLVMIESVVGKMIAAPMPITPRVAIRASVLVASEAAPLPIA